MDRRPQPDDTTQTGRPPGAVRRDAQGNAVWQWAAVTGRQALESTSRLLRKLEVPGLKLLDDDGPPPDAAGGPPARRVPKGAVRDAAQGYDPYGGRGASIASRAAPKAAASQASRAKPAQPQVKAKASFLSRLFGRR